MRNSKLDHPREYYSYWKAEHIEPERSVSKHFCQAISSQRCGCGWQFSKITIVFVFG